MTISSPRLAGLIAGVFAVRTFDVTLSAVGQLALPVGEFTARLMVAGPPLIGAVGSGAICWIYLRERQARWQHILTIVLLSLTILYGALLVATPLIATMPNVGVSETMIVRGTIQIVFAAVAIWIVTALLRRSGNGEPDRADNSGAGL